MVAAMVVLANWLLLAMLVDHAVVADNTELRGHICEIPRHVQTNSAAALLLSMLVRPILQVEPAAVSDYAELCVHLYADYCPGRLMDFLQGSQTYPLEAALEVAQQRGLIDEQVSEQHPEPC